MKLTMLEKPIQLQGQIERITFQNQDNNYIVAKIKVDKTQNLVTIVGNIIDPCPGEILIMQGKWINHPKFGTQFLINNYKTKYPATETGIIKYLGSGLIKGIGPVMAKKIVQCFKEHTLDIIENNIKKLTKIEGIGKKRVLMIKKAWDDQKEIREVMIFLQSHDISSTYAYKIFKYYGNNTIKIIVKNPYKLPEDIFGIGFILADKIAGKLGIKKDAPYRIQAGILYMLKQKADKGNTYCPYDELVWETVNLLNVKKDLVINAIKTTESEKKIVIENINNITKTFLTRYYFCEKKISLNLKKLINSFKSIRKINSEKALEWVEKKLTIKLALEQKKAVKKALDKKVLVITGGPGTGKTTIINAIIKIYSQLNIRIFLCAPTGRAAKKMKEATNHEALTIHRLLKYSIQQKGFQKNEKNLLSCDLLIVDEASMIDTLLMHHLLKAVPDTCSLILVGDVNQLPSIGAGNVLNDIISSNAFNVIKLNTIFRQAKKSMIIVNAHKINNGFFPVLNTNKYNNDFFFIEKQEPEEIVNTITELVKNRIPKKFGFNPINDIQVITPMHKGTTGAGNLNHQLQQSLNPNKEGIKKGIFEFKVSDKVMQIRNNYNKNIYNGDIGTIKKINFADQNMIINFDFNDIEYDFNDLDEIVLAYAISVHKSQGSEYPVVIIPVTTQHYILLQKNLIYTALTRGKKLVIMIGTKKALAMAIKNKKSSKRHTGLENRLNELT